MATLGKYETPRHIQLLDQILLDVEGRRIEGCIISMPPRHGKSMLVSHYFPAWYLLWNPDHRILFLTHTHEFARQWGRKVRDVFERFAPVFGLSIDSASFAVDHWNIADREGGMDCTGVGGSLTGRGANLFIVDDIVKGHREALSDRFRRDAWELWQSSVETRAEPGCGFALVGTRWHQDDVIGRIESQIDRGERQGWRVLSLRALAEDDDPLGRAPGEALWPSRYSAEKLTKLRARWDHDEARLGPYWWSALYQQRPTPREGGLIKRQWFRYYSFDDEFVHLEDGRSIDRGRLWKYVTVDLAVSTKTTADFFALGLWLVDPDSSHIFLHDVVHDRLEGPDQGPTIKRVAREHEPSFISIEAVQYQMALVQSLQREGLPAKAVRVDRDKVSRAQLAATRFSAGTIHFRRGAPWLSDLEDELLLFPNAPHDDLVDMVSMGAAEAAECVIPTIG